MTDTPSSTARGGRPTKLTPKRADHIVKVARAGLTVRLTAHYAGVSERTYMTWMARGRTATEAREDGEPAYPVDTPYVRLYERVSEARAHLALKALLQLEKRADEGDTRAIIWKLDRLYRDDYGQQGTGLRDPWNDDDADEYSTSPDLKALAERLQRNLHAVQYPPEDE
ncbi:MULTISPECIES: hypothetical protein [unclassified Streptomyces]|uniref:hypothetical protein n=1 Tax=unclassified Streptomyces TaxID=2593676 RepID=UPI002270F550|nr:MULTISPECIES: hypothetical protein [unclassified Streptomyces]MCY0923561.1 hypothetical protein [Streptomyces sp. H27-G5]MCY0962010.1 hypothetical protein [Streptomyces sp. H27-H5]